MVDNQFMDHKVSQHELAGGAKLLVIQIPNTITFYWGSIFKAGFRHVPQDKYELPHLAEHLAFAGTKKYPTPDSFKSEVERDGTYYNAFTSTDFVWYEFVGARDEIQRIIKLNMSQIYEPLYIDERIDQEKAVITQELSRNKENDAWRLGNYELSNLMDIFPDIDHRIAKLKDITRADIKNYHAERYSVAGTSFILAGDYSEKELQAIIAMLNDELVDAPKGKAPKFNTVGFKDYGGKVFGYEPFSDQQSLFSLKFTIPGKDELNDPALRLISTLLTGGMMGRLFRKAREGGLTYGIGSGAYASVDYTSITTSSQSSLDKLKPLIKLACEEISAIGRGEFSDDELERAIGYKVGTYLRSIQVPNQFANWYFDDFVHGEKLMGIDEEVKKVKSVTRLDIQRAYNKYFKLENMTLNMIGKGLSTQTDEYKKLVTQYFN